MLTLVVIAPHGNRAPYIIGQKHAQLIDVNNDRVKLKPLIIIKVLP